MSRRSEYTFFPGKHTDGQQVHGEMISINLQGNASQNYDEVSHTCQNAFYQQDKK